MPRRTAREIREELARQQAQEQSTEEPQTGVVPHSEVVPAQRVQMVNVERIREGLGGVEEQSVVVKRITEEVVARHSRELDEFVQNIHNLLERIKRREVNNISDRQLELNTIKLPVLMYFAGNGVEQLGCESDVAKARRLSEYNEIITRIEGTIPHRQATAETMTMYAQMVETIYSRAYKQLKGKMDMADKLFSALRKVLSKRMMEMDIASRERSLPEQSWNEQDEQPVIGRAREDDD